LSPGGEAVAIVLEGVELITWIALAFKIEWVLDSFLVASD
jgi:hypothetical protein